MAIIVIAFVCMGVAIWVAKLSLPFRRSLMMLLCAALAIGLLDGLGFVTVAYLGDHAVFLNAQTKIFDSIFALKMFAFAAIPAALLALAVSFFAWLVFRPIFGRKNSAPE